MPTSSNCPPSMLHSTTYSSTSLLGLLSAGALHVNLTALLSFSSGVTSRLVGLSGRSAVRKCQKFVMVITIKGLHPAVGYFFRRYVILYIWTVLVLNFPQQHAHIRMYSTTSFNIEVPLMYMHLRTYIIASNLTGSSTAR